MLRTENLTKTYGSHLAVDDVSFHIERGEIVAFLGPNGAGKTTTMRMITGALAATSGRSLIDGIDVFQEPKRVKRLLGYLPERPPLYNDMTVQGYLQYAARLKHVDDPKRATLDIIHRVGLENVGHRVIGNLSKGYRQRVGLAQALVHQPRLLILDEPSSGLDPAQRVDIRNLIQELAAGDVTVVLSTHVLQEVEALCDRALIIHRGRLLPQVQVDPLSMEQGVVTIRVEHPHTDLLEALGRIEGVHGITQPEPHTYRIQGVGEFRSQIAHAAVQYGLLELNSSKALEDVFLELTAEEQ